MFNTEQQIDKVFIQPENNSISTVSSVRDFLDSLMLEISYDLSYSPKLYTLHDNTYSQSFM